LFHRCILATSSKSTGTKISELFLLIYEFTSMTASSFKLVTYAEITQYTRSIICNQITICEHLKLNHNHFTHDILPTYACVTHVSHMCHTCDTAMCPAKMIVTCTTYICALCIYVYEYVHICVYVYVYIYIYTIQEWRHRTPNASNFSFAGLFVILQY